MSVEICFLPTKPEPDAMRDQLVQHGNALLAQGWTDAALDSWLNRLCSWEMHCQQGSRHINQEIVHLMPASRLPQRL